MRSATDHENRLCYLRMAPKNDANMRKLLCEVSLLSHTLLVAFRGGDAVALGAFGLEDLLPRLAISFGRLSKCCHTKNTMRGLARRKFWDLRLKEE